MRYRGAMRATLAILALALGCANKSTVMAGDLATVAADMSQPAPTTTGAIAVRSYDYMMGATHLTGSFAYAEFAKPMGPDPCTTTTNAGCSITTCNGSLMRTVQTAGTVALGGGTQTVTLPPDPMGGYKSVSTATVIWPPDTTVTIAVAASSDVTAIDDSIVMPRAAVISAPAVGSTTTQSRAMPLTVSWTPGGGTLTVEIIDANMKTMRCPFDAATGSGTIAAAALAQFAAGTVSVSVSQVRVKSFVAGDRAIELDASTFPVAPNGNVWNGATLTLQ
jgi:hypothetical protein